MSDCMLVPTSLLQLDPFKRVKYELGQVLGKDELEQEQYYFMEQGRMHNRVLHGYGTVCGLKVSTRTINGQTRVVVGAGLAVDSKGRLIHVNEDYCQPVVVGQDGMTTTELLSNTAAATTTRTT